jgi:hypothetical protein
LVGAVLSSPQSILLRKGLLSDADFWRWAQRQLPSNYDGGLIQQEWYNGYMLDEEVYSLIASLRKKYSIIPFSGNIQSRVLISKLSITSATCSISKFIHLIFT